MSERSQRDGASALRGFLSVLSRRRWIVLAALLLVPLPAVGLSILQEDRYEATADVLLQRGSVAATITGASDANAGVPVERIIGTRAELARLPAVATRALDVAGVAGATPQQLLQSSSVEALGETDILAFAVRDGNPVLATRLATAYATEFTAYMRELDQAALEDARAQVQRRLRAVDGLRPFRTSQLRQRFVALTRRARELETLQAIQTPSAVVVRPAEAAEKVQPRPVRSGVLGLGFGLLLGIGVALLWEALDSRVRSSDQIEAGLDMPLLARLGAPRRRSERRPRPGHAQRSGERGGRGVPAAAGQPHVRHRLVRRALDHGDQRRRGRGQVDDGRQPGRRPRADGQAGDPGRPRPAPPRHRPLLRPRGRPRADGRRARHHPPRRGRRADPRHGGRGPGRRRERLERIGRHAGGAAARRAALQPGGADRRRRPRGDPRPPQRVGRDRADRLAAAAGHGRHGRAQREG